MTLASAGSRAAVKHEVRLTDEPVGGLERIGQHLRYIDAAAAAAAAIFAGLEQQ
jgi:hypothetical protein